MKYVFFYFEGQIFEKLRKLLKIFEIFGIFKIFKIRDSSLVALLIIRQFCSRGGGSHKPLFSVEIGGA